MKRRGRRHLPKLRATYRRGGGVVRDPTTPWGPMNIMDGGRDEPLTPMSRNRRLMFSIAALAAAVVAVAVVVLTR